MNIRRTKIVATLGPATDNPVQLEQLIRAGVNVVRLNFSHGHPEDHRQRASLVREISEKLQRTVAILGDLQGPKIRIARFATGPVQLAIGDQFILDAMLDQNVGDQTHVGIDYKQLPEEVNPGDRLLLDDGRVVLQVIKIEGARIVTQVQVAGTLSNNKGINREGGGLSAAALTDKDLRDIELAAEIDVDYLAVSFVRSADDIEQARALLQQAGGSAGVVAKIERAEAVSDNSVLEKIIRTSDAIMVARGDLGVEIGDAELMAVQKSMIRQARRFNKSVITATQMMESMISNSLPTRAEVFDVANAVLDGTDAVMLSAETAAGNFPVETVAAMHRIIVGAERYPQAQTANQLSPFDYNRADEAIAMACIHTANGMPSVRAIICLTETGHTPLLMSRVSTSIPIFAFTRTKKTERWVVLYRGVNPIKLADLPDSSDDLIDRAITQLLEREIVFPNDTVIVSKGDHKDVHGGTNTMKIIDVKNVRMELHHSKT
ncbi:pyruvate kinase [Halioxenophilus sp. WMMB6]|uniref:pyruvate kinase n=1 Tax=Halioxenophilus sp. WMMB6 TaxID=3073815 RepID=UPI00295F4776|nr:pyruvate kinase [Halioxenophilus sp. WMMB6]